MNSFFSFLNHRNFVIINIVILFILVNAIAYHSNIRIDLTKEKINSVSESTYKVIHKLKLPLLIEAYISKDVPGQIVAQLQPIIYQLEDIQRIGKDKIKLKIINPNTEELRSLASKRGIQGIPIEEADIARASVRLGYFGIYLQYGDKDTTLSLVERGGIVGNFEYLFLKEVKKLIQSKESISGIGYIKVPGALQIRRWQNRMDQNKDNLYAFKSFIEKEMGSIKEIELNSPIPDTIETLMMIGLPELTKKQQIYIDQFLMRGGNLLLMLKGFDFTLTPPNPRLLQLGIASNSGGFATIPDGVKKMNEFLNRYGLEIKSRVVLEPSLAAPELDIMGQYLVRYANPSWAIYTGDTGNINTSVELMKYTPQVIFPWFSDLAYNSKIQPSVQYKVLVHTTKNAITRKETSLTLKEMQMVGKSPDDHPVGKHLPLMILAQGKFISGYKDEWKNGELDFLDSSIKEKFLTGQIGNTESKIVMIGTPYLVSDIFFRNEANLEYFKVNYAFILNILEYLQGDTDLLAVRSKIPTIPFLQIQFPPQLEMIFSWFHTLIIPIILAIYGFIRLRKRYKKQGVEE